MQKSILRVAVVTLAILLIPLMAMQFSSDVVWDLFDFVVMGILLFGTGLALEAVRKKLTNRTHRVVVGIVIVGAFLLIWAELAVGLFGSPWAGS